MANLNRRHAVAGAAGVGIGLPLLAACGADESASPVTGTTATAAPDGGNPTPSTDGERSSPAGDGLVAAADVPVGGGVVLGDASVVVTQPSDGEFKAFSATCTHQGCQVGSVADGEIVCPCHGSHFSIADGSVVAGPAPSPLPEVAVQVRGGQVVQG